MNVLFTSFPRPLFEGFYFYCFFEFVLSISHHPFANMSYTHYHQELLAAFSLDLLHLSLVDRHSSVHHRLLVIVLHPSLPNLKTFFLETQPYLSSRKADFVLDIALLIALAVRYLLPTLALC